MDDTQKMLKAIINGQSIFRQEVQKSFDKLREDLGGRIDKVEKNLKELTERVDNLGRQLAYLEDDAPTREEFDNLENRVDKLEHQSPSAV